MTVADPSETDGTFQSDVFRAYLMLDAAMTCLEEAGHEERAESVHEEMDEVFPLLSEKEQGIVTRVVTTADGESITPFVAQVIDSIESTVAMERRAIVAFVRANAQAAWTHEEIAARIEAREHAPYVKAP